MPTTPYSEMEAAQALTKVIGSSSWIAVAFAHGYLAMLKGMSDEEAARITYSAGAPSFRGSREFIQQSRTLGFLKQLTPREKIGSAENPITKLFPATVTEQRFLELLDDLHDDRPSLDYVDDRESGQHTLTDFILLENGLELPVNIKNAGTRFERAQELVHLAPDDCIPIPAYKAYAAIEKVPNLLYAVSIDYNLVSNLNTLLPKILNQEETIVWELLSSYTGSRVRKAEDEFIFNTVRRHWSSFKQIIQNNPFHVISARKAIRILQDKPQRTPGLGLRAWGTGASAEVNVHISVQEDTTPWSVVSERIKEKGIIDIIGAVNRKRMAEIYDPEI